MQKVKQFLPEKSTPFYYRSSMLGAVSDRVRIIRKELNLTQEALGKLAGVTKAAVSGWERDISKPQRDALLSLWLKVKLNPEWLMRAKGEKFIKEPPAEYRIDLSKHDPMFSLVPLISWDQACNWIEINKSFVPTNSQIYKPTSQKVSSNAFALLVQGDSMENPNGRPTYPEGSIIIIDPERSVEHGKRIIIKIEPDQDPVFRQLSIEGSKNYLKPLNPRYQISELSSGSIICGVLVQTIIDEN